MGRLGPPPPRTRRTPLAPQPIMLPSLLGLKSSETGSQSTVPQWEQGRRMDDIEEILSLPLHTVPPPSQLKNTLVKNRLLALPRLAVAKKEEPIVKVDNEDQQMLKKQ